MVSIEERFLFDLQGFLILRGVLSADECACLADRLQALEFQEFADEWQAALAPGVNGRPTREQQVLHQIRYNGLPRLDAAFDRLIDHPGVLPYVQAFVGEPQLINTWSIAKSQHCPRGGWHRGVPTTDYSYKDGVIRSRMFNTVYFLTDNGLDDGCMVALPGSHKSNFDLAWRDYTGLETPGVVPVLGKAGDVLIFSEALMHDGLPKSSEGIRVNLYYNYVHAHYNVMMREPTNAHHFYFPPEVRQRFTQEQRALTRWMEFTRWEY
jgi:ectoine hydroxylase-related dioxygenase (phytanoyl-CoA dioxygenase family)